VANRQTRKDLATASLQKQCLAIYAVKAH